MKWPSLLSPFGSRISRRGEGANVPSQKKDHDRGQTRRQSGGTGHVASCSSSVLPNSDNSTHASVKVSLASFIRLVRFARDPGVVLTAKQCRQKTHPILRLAEAKHC